MRPGEGVRTGRLSRIREGGPVVIRALRGCCSPNGAGRVRGVVDGEGAG